MRARRQVGSRLYIVLLGLQSSAALTILIYIQSAFRILIGGLGVVHPVVVGDIVSLAAAILICQVGFWVRVKHVAIPSWHSIVLGHLLSFAGRVSFIFGGALFAVFFLRHIPELGLDAFGVAWRGAIVMTTLFALYCYALELERLGAALQTEPLQAPAADPDKSG